jgi:hypothetical protein
VPRKNLFSDNEYLKAIDATKPCLSSTGYRGNGGKEMDLYKERSPLS